MKSGLFKRMQQRGWLAVGACVALVAVAVPTVQAMVPGKAPSRVAVPSVAAEKGEKCVEETAFMRRNHMTVLKHQRDKTLREGIRTQKHSLQGCIDCHASQKTGSVLGSRENFCQGCHDYVAVKLDCWDCHASKPKARGVATAPPEAHFSPIGVDGVSAKPAGQGLGGGGTGLKLPDVNGAGAKQQ